MTKLDDLKRAEQVAQAELVSARTDRADRFAALSAMARPTEAAAASVAALDIKLDALALRYEDAHAAVKAEQARLEGPEVRAALKEIKAIRAALVSDRSEVTHQLAGVAPIVERMATKWNELNRLSDLVGDGSGLAGMESLYQWLTDVVFDMRTMHERGSLFEGTPGNGHKPREESNAGTAHTS